MSRLTGHPEDSRDLQRLADLIRARNANETAISRITGGPAHPSHIAKYIASRIFDIELARRANNPGSSGRFRSGASRGNRNGSGIREPRNARLGNFVLTCTSCSQAPSLRLRLPGEPSVLGASGRSSCSKPSPCSQRLASVASRWATPPAFAKRTGRAPASIRPRTGGRWD